MSMRFFFLLAALLGISGPMVLGSDKPIGLVAGTSYGRTEAKTLMRHVFQDELGSVTVEECGEYLAPEDFERFGLVILAGSIEQVYTAEQSAEIDRYVQQGGRLLLIQQSPKNFSVAGPDVDRDSAYLFGRSYFQRDGLATTVLQPEHPLLKEVFEQNAEPFWLNGNVVLRSEEWETLVGAEGFILIGVRELGEGKIYYAGHELFRIQSNSRLGKEPDADAWIRLLRNIVLDVDPA